MEGFDVKVHCSRIQIAVSLPHAIPQDNNDSQLHSEALSQQTDELNKSIRHQMFMLIAIQKMNSIQVIQKKLPLTI